MVAVVRRTLLFVAELNMALVGWSARYRQK